eukprot:1137788-Pelagomonas_calceolata.AAC.2
MKCATHLLSIMCLSQGARQSCGCSWSCCMQAQQPAPPQTSVLRGACLTEHLAGLPLNARGSAWTASLFSCNPSTSPAVAAAGAWPWLPPTPAQTAPERQQLLQRPPHPHLSVPSPWVAATAAAAPCTLAPAALGVAAPIAFCFLIDAVSVDAETPAPGAEAPAACSVCFAGVNWECHCHQHFCAWDLQQRCRLHA